MEKPKVQDEIALHVIEREVKKQFGAEEFQKTKMWLERKKISRKRREGNNRPSLSWRECSGEYRDTCSDSVLMR